MARRAKINKDFKKKYIVFPGGRAESIKNYREYLLILCEGKKTEPNYFNGFKNELPKQTVKIDIIGASDNTINLIKKAIKKREDEKKEGNEYDDVWVVFDKDSFPDQDFNNAIFSGKSNKINCAYSNQAFELWYLLHFELSRDAMHRSQYKKRISTYLKKEYKKNDPDMYSLLKEHQSIAIKHAKKLFNECDHACPAKENPKTVVFKLVEKLNKLIKKYS